MTFIARLRVLVGATVTISAVGLVYATAGKRLIGLAGSGGRHSGITSNTVDKLDTVVPLILVVLLLAVFIWFIVSSVQEERAVRRTR